MIADDDLALRDLVLCFEGAVPAVIATTSADGTPNVTYLSSVRLVDDHRVALSNQFFSKTARNLAEVPRASMLVIDPTRYDEFRLTLAYERTERHGPVFERLRADVDAVAVLTHMENVFKLRAADIYRVERIERVGGRGEPVDDSDRPSRSGAKELGALNQRLSRSRDLDALVSVTVNGLHDLMGYEHSALLLLDEEGSGLYTIASHGYDAEGVGSEVTVGDGIIGMAAARCAPIRLGNLRQMAKYSQTVRRSYEGSGHLGPQEEIALPALSGAQSRVAVPAMVLGQLVGVLVVESPQPVAFGPDDEELLMVVASLVAGAIETERAQERAAEPTIAGRTAASVPEAPSEATAVRFFAVDGSTFVDGEYLIKGVAGRILWSVLNHYQRERRVDFTQKELRLDASLELPGFRDNLDSRLILLKRRLDERQAPVRIEKTGRGRFRLLVHTELRLELMPA